MGWNKVMKACGSRDEKVVAKTFQLVFNAGRSEDVARQPALSRRWQSKSSLGSGVGGASFQDVPAPPPSAKVSLRLGTPS